MKKIKWLAPTLVLAIIPVMTWVSISHAQRFSPMIADDQTVHGSLYAANKTIDIKGIVHGDIFCAGQSVKIDAEVHGDVICAGVEVTVNGTVDGDIRLAGQIVNVDAQISGSATVAAAEFSLDATANVGRDLTATGSALNIKGKVGRDVVASGSVTTVNGAVGRNITADVGQLILKDDACVVGNITYTSNNKLDQTDGAVISGEITQTQPSKRGYSFDPLWYLFMLTGLPLIVMALTFLFPRFTERTSAQIREHFGKTLVVGILATLLVPGVLFGLAITVVGIPLAFVLMAALLLAVLLSGPLVARFIGGLLVKNAKAPVLAAALGGVVLVTLYFLPFVGLVFIMLAFFLGFGAILIELQRYIKSSKA